MSTRKIQTGTTVNLHSRFIDFLELTKPELTMLSVLTAVCSAFLAMQGSMHYYLLIHTFIGTSLVGGAAGALNQYIERNADAIMNRTAHRPLPSGRIQAYQAFIFGSILAVSGVLYLTFVANFVAGALAVITLVNYLFVYTPLKKHTPFAPLLGGISGAAPTLIGWAIVTNEITIESLSLFFILLFWQIPHYLSLGWIYREDYSRVGYKILTVIDTRGRIVSRQILIYCTALIPASVMPVLIGMKGLIYFTVASVLSIGFLAIAFRMSKERTYFAARKLFFASLVFLSLLFVILILT